MTNELVTIQPGELIFPFEVKKQSSCSLQLVNNTDNDVAFKVKTTSPKKYCVRPNTGVVPPKATCDVTVTMQAQREAPPDMQCRDKFLVQSVIVPTGTSDITPDMFMKEPGKVVEENKLRVVYVSPPQTTSPVPEPLEEEEGSAPKDHVSDGQSESFTSLDKAPRDLNELKAKLSEAMSAISKLMEEKNAVVQQKQQLQQEMAAVKRTHRGRTKMGFSFLFVCFIGLVGIVVGYFFHS